MVYARPLPTPTDAEPGSSQKIDVLAERVARGERLWHPDDNTRQTMPNGRPRRLDEPADLARCDVITSDGRTLGGYRV